MDRPILLNLILKLLILKIKILHYNTGLHIILIKIIFNKISFLHHTKI